MANSGTSPFQVLDRLVEAFRDGEYDESGFIAGLDTVDQFLHSWWGNVDKLQVPAGYAEGNQLKVAAQDGLKLLAEAVDHLREYGKSRDEETARKGLVLAKQAHDVLAGVMGSTQDNMARLDSQM